MENPPKQKLRFFWLVLLKLLCFLAMLVLGDYFIFMFLSDPHPQNLFVVNFIVHTGNANFLFFCVMAMVSKDHKTLRIAALIALPAAIIFWFVIFLPGYGFAACGRALLGVEPASFAHLLLSIPEALFLMIVLNLMLRLKFLNQLLIICVIESGFVTEGIFRAMFQSGTYELLPWGFRFAVLATAFYIIRNHKTGKQVLETNG